MSELQSNTIRKNARSAFGPGIIITIYMILKPLYLFSSGLPQVSDMFLIAAAGFLLLRERGRIPVPGACASWVCIFIATLVFQVVVQCVWWLKTDDDRMLLMAAYYIFNFIAALLCIYIGGKIGIEQLKFVICKGCFFSILVTALGFLISGGSRLRTTGFFNNPNQLGYYALLVMTIIAFFPDQLPKWQNAVIIVIAVWANILSLSKASVIGLAGLAVCYALWGSKDKTVKKAVLQALLLALVFGVIYWFLYSGSRFVSGNRTLAFLRRRILYMSMENDSSLGAGRGYDRVQEVGIHFLWGKGEGAYYRFKSLPGLEVHATFINLFVSYGLIGLAAYVWIMVKGILKRGMTLRNFACFSGVFMYFFTHNGIRNTLFWILLSVVLQTSADLGKKNDQKVLRRD